VADGRIALPPSVPDASYQRKYGALGLIKLLGPGGVLLTSHSLKLAQSPSIPDHPVQLGGNLYAKDRVPVKRPRGGAAPPTDAEHDAAASAAAASELPTPPPPAPPPPHASSSGARRCRIRVSALVLSVTSGAVSSAGPCDNTTQQQRVLLAT